MPNYDLSSANLGLVANQQVDTLRISNQDVWVANHPVYTVFDGAPLDLTSHNDATGADFLMNQFHKLSGPPLEIVDVGIYVPSASMLIGQTGFVAVQSGTGFLRDSSYPIAGAVATKTATSTPLAVGWNWYPLSVPFIWPEDELYLLAGYVIGSFYLYSTDLTDVAIPSTEGTIELVAQHLGSGFPERGWYAPGGGADFSNTESRSYGIDIRARVI